MAAKKDDFENTFGLWEESRSLLFLHLAPQLAVHNRTLRVVITFQRNKTWHRHASASPSFVRAHVTGETTSNVGMVNVR